MHPLLSSLASHQGLFAGHVPFQLRRPFLVLLPLLIASFNKCLRLPLALSLELIRTLSSQLFFKFCQGVFKLIALLVKISKVIKRWFHTLQLVCS